MSTPTPVEGVDPRVRDFLVSHDPTVGLPTHPLTASADQIIASAESRSKREHSALTTMFLFNGVRTARKWFVPAGIAVAMVAILGLATIATRQRPDEQPLARTVPVVLTFEYSENEVPPPARRYLRDLAERIKSLPGHPPRKRYTYVHLQSWSRDDTAPPGGQDGVVAHDLRVWWDGDHSGRRWDRRLPAQRGSLPAEFLDEPPAASVGRPEDFGPGGIGVIVKRDPSTLAFNLAGQLADEEPVADGPQYTLRAVAGMCRFHYLDPLQRSAVLQVLSDTDGILDFGAVTDRAGRVGRAVGVESTGERGRIRDVLVFDDRTGRLLSYEQMLVDDASSSATSVRSYVLYLDHRYVEKLP